jgi:4'-phosphopantetheinyl transferase
VKVIEVFFIEVNAPADVIEALTGWLVDAELARANRYRFPDDRRRSIVARAATRRLLGRSLNADPRSLVLIEEEHGKPALADHQIEFNASHSGVLVALAVARETPVGIDVERQRTLSDTVALAERYFSPTELALVRSDPDPNDAFFTIWTAKEAIVKASGKGIGTSDLRGFTVPFRSAGMQPVVDGWSVASLEAPLDSYYSAVAARSGKAESVISRTLSATALL